MPKLKLNPVKNDLYMITIPEMEISQEIDEIDLFKILGPKNYAQAKTSGRKEFDVTQGRIDTYIK